jgi:hypothetical protein
MVFCTSTETCYTLKLYDDVTAVLDLIDGFHPLLYVFIYLYISLYIFIYLYISLYIFIYLYISLYIFIYLYISLYILYIFIYLYISLYIFIYLHHNGMPLIKLNVLVTTEDVPHSCDITTKNLTDNIINSREKY